MQMRSANRALWIWIAVFAVLMNALAPAVSHAMAYGEGNPALLELCRADKSKPLSPAFLPQAGGQSRDGKPGKSMAMGEDCGYCVTHGGSAGMPPSLVSGLPFAAPAQTHPFLFYRAPQPLTAWSASRPRGPPAAV